MAKPVIPIFYSCDENFLQYCLVSMASLLKNASPDYVYCIYILNTDIPEEAQKKFQDDLGSMQFSAEYKVQFEDVTDNLNLIEHEFPLRDYYSKTTYFRLLISDMHPELDKAVYIDADTIIQGNISAFYNVEIGEYYLAACHEQVMVQIKEYGGCAASELSGVPHQADPPPFPRGTAYLRLCRHAGRRLLKPHLQGPCAFPGSKMEYRDLRRDPVSDRRSAYPSLHHVQ